MTDGRGHPSSGNGLSEVAALPEGQPGEASQEPAQIAKKSVAGRPSANPVLLAGGNPQITKANGDAPVQAYITAMPGWKSELGRRLDELIVRTAPGVRKAVRWKTTLELRLP